jgi:hypothetical protein
MFDHVVSSQFFKGYNYILVLSSSALNMMPAASFKSRFYEIDLKNDRITTAVWCHGKNIA